MDLTRIRLLRPLFFSRWPRLVLVSVSLGGYLLTIAAGFGGTSVGSRNPAIVGVWIAWWSILILIAVPLLGRAWCSICPIPAPGEWIQRGSVLGPIGRGLGLHLRWPRRLRNLWLQNASFALLAAFSLVILTQPQVTAGVLAGLLVAATAMALVFEGRAFCRYVCPVGGFIGLFSQFAPLELRARDQSLCAAHRPKTCAVGSEQAFGCPWQVYPAALRKNSPCGLCLECLQACPYDNLAVRLRPFAKDLVSAGNPSLAEGFKALLMVGTGLLYSAVMLGPWPELRSAAFRVGTWPWVGYSAGFLGVALLGIPGAFLVAAAVSRRLSGAAQAIRSSFPVFAAGMVPVGLAIWAVFSLTLVLNNLPLLIPAISDPFAQGWGLAAIGPLGEAIDPGRVLPPLQALILVAGMLGSARLVLRSLQGQPDPRGMGALRRGVLRTASPFLAFIVIVTLAELWLMTG